MALNIPGLTADLIAKLKSGDLRALETLFRAAFPALLAKAKETLDDDGAAARVVERLIPKLFAERATLTTPDALTGMLDGAVHEAAVRERSRLAGIRKRDDGGKKTATVAPTADDVWGKISAVLQGPSAEDLAAASQMKEKLAHEAAGHIKQMTSTTPLVKRLAALGALLIVVGGLLWGFAKSGEKGRLGRQISSAVKDIKTGSGQRGEVKFDDGSTAKFGADTRAIIPESFDKEARGVGIEGVAEFSPVSNPAMPFTVMAGKTGKDVPGAVVLVTAKGAETFAVRHYREDDAVLVQVKNGSVDIEIEEPTGAKQTLGAGQALMIASDGKTSEPTAAQLAEAFGYVDGTFSIDNKTLKHTLAEIKKWYGTELFLKDTTFGSKIISVTAPLTSTNDAIKAIETASGLVFGWEGQTKVLKEKGKP